MEAATQTWDGKLEAHLLRVCIHYGVPVVSLRAALFGDGMPRRLLSDDWPRAVLEGDGHNLHPNALGHTMVAQLILARIDAAAAAMVSGGRQEQRCCLGAASPRLLPTPLLPDGREGGRPSTCARGEALRSLVLESRCWPSKTANLRRARRGSASNGPFPLGGDPPSVSSSTISGRHG